jgi:LmbE family N-acetylglucosaminyl deacetylase
MTSPRDFLRKSIIVAAHPDDEILWFSSIIERVDEIVVCFLDVDSMPEWSKGRRESMSAYPLPNTSWLGITESEVFDGANWPTPSAAEYGLRIVKRKGSLTRYQHNFEALKTQLRDKLAGFSNVYTHNPWGEYGHEEHVQVYSVVKDLQATMRFNMWHSNYFSNKSALYMNSHLCRASLDNYRLPTNKTIASTIMELYKRHNCWTWYNDYDWPDNECFILDEKSRTSNKSFGQTVDLNFIRIWVAQNKRRGAAAVINRSVRAVARKFR